MSAEIEGMIAGRRRRRKSHKVGRKSRKVGRKSRKSRRTRRR